MALTPLKLPLLTNSHGHINRMAIQWYSVFILHGVIVGSFWSSYELGLDHVFHGEPTASEEI